MKKLFYTLLAGCCLGLSAQQALAQCKVRPIIKHCMPDLGKYQYDSYAVQEITFGPQAKKAEIQFSVYSGEEYRLVFGKTVLPQEIGIKIYDGNPKSKNSKLVYFDDSGKKDNFVCSFEPTKTGTYYIVYDVPAATAPNQQGCFVLLIGIMD